MFQKVMFQYVDTLMAYSCPLPDFQMFFLIILSFIQHLGPTSTSLRPVIPRKLSAARFRHSLPLMLTYLLILLQNKDICINIWSTFLTELNSDI